MSACRAGDDVAIGSLARRDINVETDAATLEARAGNAEPSHFGGDS